MFTTQMSIPVICVYQDLKVPLVSATVLFEDPSALIKKKSYECGTASCFSPAALTNTLSQKVQKSRGENTSRWELKLSTDK